MKISGWKGPELRLLVEDEHGSITTFGVREVGGLHSGDSKIRAKSGTTH